MVTPASAGMAGPAVDTGATGKNTNHTTDSFFTEGRRHEGSREKYQSDQHELVSPVTCQVDIIQIQFRLHANQ